MLEGLGFRAHPVLPRRQAVRSHPEGERGIAKHLTIDRVRRCPPNIILSSSCRIVRAVRNFRDKAPKNRLAAICLLLLNLLSFGAGAQITEPLLPVPAPPNGPQAPAL